MKISTKKLIFLAFSLLLAVTLVLGVKFLVAPEPVRAESGEEITSQIKIAHDNTFGEDHENGATAIGADYFTAGYTLYSGRYFLTENIDLSETITIEGEVMLCLDGFTLNGNGSDTVIDISDGAEFLLYDCDKSGNGAITGGVSTQSDMGGGVTTHGGSFIMNGGAITGNTTNIHGGGVCIYDGTFEMNGGTIVENTGYKGGGVYVSSNGVFIMQGGTISGNLESYIGGGVYAYGTFTMKGGTISDNSASYGGGVYVANYSFFIMEGGIISGNSAKSIGGGVFASIATFKLQDGEITGNTADRGGGVACLYAGNITFEINGGEITGNTADRGGGVYLLGGNFILQDGEISGNTSQTYGGGIYAERFKELIIENGEIKNNKSDDSGGGVYISNGTIEMNSGEISGNTSQKYGSGVYIDNGGTFEMNGGEIAGNTEASYGGGVSIYYGTFEMNGGAITGNKSQANGGGVYCKHSAFTLNGGEITGNTAEYEYGFGGGVDCETGGTIEMNGGEITGNTATYGGGGVWVDVGAVGAVISGDSVVTGNKLSDGTRNNFSIYNEQIINLGELDEGAEIGITFGVLPRQGSFTSGGEYKNNFFSDDDSMCVWSIDGDLWIKRHEISDIPVYDGEGQQPPTCTEGGMVRYYCKSGCGYLGNEEDAAAFGHSYRHVDEKGATCTADGHIEHYYCDRCGSYFFAEDGITVSFEDIKLAALGHSYRHVDEKGATCTADGHIEHYYCGRCGSYFFAEDGITVSFDEDIKIDALGHDFIKEWDSNADGHWHKCTRCDVIAKADHNWNDGEITKQPTETETGEKKFTCNDCGYTKTETVPATGGEQIPPAGGGSTDTPVGPDISGGEGDNPTENSNSEEFPWFVFVIVGVILILVVIIIIGVRRKGDEGDDFDDDFKPYA